MRRVVLGLLVCVALFAVVMDAQRVVIRNKLDPDNPAPPAQAGLCTTAETAGTARYVRAGATGTGSGTNWTDATTALPATLVRGRTYCVADGTYAAYTFDDAPSGTTPITVTKATVSDHGISTGWSDTFGDGDATFGDTEILTKYIDIVGPFTFDDSLQMYDFGTVSNVAFINISSVTVKSMFILGEDILVSGSNLGGFNACDTAFPEDVIQIWDNGSSQAANRVSFVNNTIHDVSDNGDICAGQPGAGRHVDCVQMLGGAGHLFDRNTFYNCATSVIIGESLNVALSGLIIRNNYIGQVMNPGATINFGGKTLTNLTIEYNTIMGAPGWTFTCVGTCLARGNIISNVGSCGTPTYSYNLFITGGTCGSNAQTGTPTFVNNPSPSYLNGDVPNYAFTSCSSAGVNQGNPASYPATDRIGTARYLGAAPDIGASECIQ